MKNILSNTLTADEIAKMADNGEDISRFFTNTGTMKYPSCQVQIDFPGEMFHELDELASKLHVNIQAIIITYLRQALDRHYLAKNRT
ncbi:hypothetical protein KKH56_07820 [bacterium]|nr:hypothetical protein [bacterium]MBU2461575.1 hypothetical protein [bacterium]